MKKKFLTPEIKVISVKRSQIIATSDVEPKEEGGGFSKDNFFEDEENN